MGRTADVNSNEPRGTIAEPLCPCGSPTCPNPGKREITRPLGLTDYQKAQAALRDVRVAGPQNRILIPVVTGHQGWPYSNHSYSCASCHQPLETCRCPQSV